MSQLLATSWLCFLLTVLSGCSEGTPRIEKSVVGSKDKAVREWRRNEAILVRAIEGSSDEEQLLEAVMFFKELTGISVRGDGTTFGFLPDEGAREDLVRLQKWCELYCDQIYWDEAAQKVKRFSSGNDV